MMSPVRMEKLESSIRLVLAFHEAFNRHDADGMMQMMSADCVLENTFPAPNGTVYEGKEAVARFWQDFFHQSPQAHLHIEEIFGLGLRCVMRWRYEWVEPDGSRRHVRGVDIFKVQDGLISQKLSYVKA